MLPLSQAPIKDSRELGKVLPRVLDFVSAGGIGKYSDVVFHVIILVIVLGKRFTLFSQIGIRELFGIALREASTRRSSIRDHLFADICAQIGILAESGKDGPGPKHCHMRHAGLRWKMHRKVIAAVMPGSIVVLLAELCYLSDDLCWNSKRQTI